MPQNGAHGLVGLALARAWCRRVPAQDAAAFAGALVIGAMLPDVDVYPTAIAVLAGGKSYIEEIHRTATHSIFLVPLLLVVAAAMRGQWRWGLVGLAIGIASHIILDIFFWFAAIELFWPLTRPKGNGVLPVINAWAWLQDVPPIVKNIREAFEFCFFALYLKALARIAPDAGAKLRKAEIAAWIFFGLCLVTGTVFSQSTSPQMYIVTTPYLLFFLPFCWFWTWKLRQEIADWARRR